MFKNYFKTAWRNVLKNKGYSALNILGLGTGMAVTLLIGLWVHFEYSYDKFLPNYERLYQVRRNFNSNGEILNFTTTSLRLAEALRQVPEIENVAESDWMGEHGLMVGDKKLYIKGTQIGADFLKMFEYTLLQGNINTAFKSPYSIVLTESSAKSLFGNENPMGKIVRYDNENDLVVTGILKDVPANSTLQFQFIVPFSFLDATKEFIRERRVGSFSGNAHQIFVKLREGASYAQVSAKIKDIQKVEKSSTNAMNSDVVLQPIKNWHLYSNYVNGVEQEGFLEYVRMFSIIGLLVLAIACINFINLTTARSEKRAREVGVRKAIGSLRKDLIFQFLMESFLLTVIAFGLSLALVQIALPGFNTLTGSKISIPFSNVNFWLLMFGCVLLTALAAGSRPAFYLSSFRPVNVLKGTLAVGKGASLPRKILVVLQFSCSIALIISTVIIYQQIQHSKNRPVGYDIDRLMITYSNSDLNKNFAGLKDELLKSGVVSHVTKASGAVTQINWHSDVDQWQGKNAGETIEMGTVVVDDNYFKTLGVDMQEGRVFSGPPDTVNVIFNEAAVKSMRLKNPLGQTVTWGGNSLRIVGIAKNALMASPFAPAEPTMFLYNTDQNCIMYRLAPQVRTADAVAQLTTIFNKYSPAFPYTYQFADESYANKFKLEVLIGKLAGIFAALAIFISCLGLLGLAAYIAEQRTKEIGIRKVLGATVSQVWMLLSKDFLMLVLISCVIASPVAFYFLQNWLEKYSYRVQIGAGVFLLSAIAAILITIITISFQAIKAALANPVKSLRSE